MSSETPSLDGDLREWREAIIEKCREALVGGNEERYAAAKDAAAAAESRIRTTVRALQQRIADLELGVRYESDVAEQAIADAKRFAFVREHAQSGLVMANGVTVHRWTLDLPFQQGVSADWLRDGIDRVRSQEDSANG